RTTRCVSCEARVPKDHPWRPIQRIVDEALTIPPERLLRVLLLQAFYSVRSQKQVVEQLDYNLLFRWFVGLSLDEEVWDETVFTKNRERLIEGDIARKFMAAVLSQGSVKALLSDDHFSVRHTDRGLGQHEELSSQGRQRRATGCGTKW